MNTEEKIIQYIKSQGLDITPYIDDFRHVVPGTVCIIGIRMWGRCGDVKKWWILTDILKNPQCPVRMQPVESSLHERPQAFNRLVWKEEE